MGGGIRFVKMPGLFSRERFVGVGRRASGGVEAVVIELSFTSLKLASALGTGKELQLTSNGG